MTGTMSSSWVAVKRPVRQRVRLSCAVVNMLFKEIGKAFTNNVLIINYSKDL